MKLRILALVFVFISFLVFPSVTRAQSSTNSCVAVAGDSVDYGDVIYEDPSSGSFPVKNTGHLSNLLGVRVPLGMSVIDYSVPAASLTVSNIYNDSQVANSNCQYIVVGPWVNDLGQGESGPTVAAIGKLINDITSKSPGAKIFLVNYYTPSPASWATNIWPKGFSSSRVADFNAKIQSAFGSNSKVTIADVRGFGVSDVATDYSGKKADGVHLSVTGKQKLADLLAGLMTSSAATTQSTTGASSTTSTTPTSGLPFAQCVGTGLAKYMNTVISGAGNLPHIKLLSPVFNVTDSKNTPGIIDAMQSAGADFRSLAAIAANTYILDGIPGYKYYTDNLKSLASGTGKAVVFTEYGSVDLSKSPAQPGGTTQLTADFLNIASDQTVFGALFFNAMGTSPDPTQKFAGFALSSNQIRTITGGTPSKAGVNSATFVMGGGAFPDRVKAYDSNLGWDLEILNTPGDLQAAVDAVNHANAAGLKPVLRLCASGNTCAFADPQVLVNFIKSLSGRINGDAWIVAGPNEPETEMWATPSCGPGGNTTPVSLYDVSNEVPCDAVVNPEFHSLRPYPASPCYKKVEETAMMCSNDLIVKKTFHVTPNGNCSAPDANGNYTCRYEYSGVQDTVSIDLTNAKLPIVGNTEDVPNATWTSTNTSATNLTAEQRVNNYVSWYLNGITNRAEEDFSADDSKYLVNFSGPLNKLLPFAIQQVTRIASVDKASNHSANDNDSRHNQIVGCLFPGTIVQATGPFPCYLDSLQNIIEIIQKQDTSISISDIITGQAVRDIQKRLASWTKPPLESDFSTFADFWKAYLEWKGQVCIPTPITILGKQFNFCLGVPSSYNFYANFFNHIPYSSTEDRVGQVLTDTNDPNTGQLAQSIQLKDGEGNGGTVTSVSFTPDSNSHNLYFSHMQEDAQLAKLLQGTVATKGDPGDPNNWEGQLKSAINNQNEARPGNTYGCVKQEIKTNSGDKLYGNLDRVTAEGKTDKKITGTLKYDTSFTCEFKPQTDQKCVADGGKNCTTTNECTKDIYTSLSIYTKTPKSYEVWQRLVGCDPSDPNQQNCLGSGGSMGVFKRFYPQSGINSPLINIKDIPASTTVSYNSDAETKAGTTGQDGSNANLYFAHIGSLEEYFLQGIQKALRPKLTAEQLTTGQGFQCTGLADNVNIHRILNSPNAFINDKTIALALKVAQITCTPAEILIGMMAKESRGLANGDVPYTGDPNEVGNRNCSIGSNFGAYCFLDIDIRAQYKYRAAAMNACLSALGLPTGSIDNLPDKKILGVSLCAAAVEFWDGMICAPSQRACSGAEQPLSSISAGQLENAALEFHAKDCDPSQTGKNKDSDGAWKYYDQFIKIYAPDVARVRAQCR